MRRKIIRFLLCAYIALYSSGVRADSLSYTTDLNAFLWDYTPLVYQILVKIRQHSMTPHKRFLVLEAKKEGYVQCLFHNNDTEIYCEASSGFYNEPRSKVSSKQYAAIAAQGFNMDDSNGNFKIDSIRVKDNDTLWNVARMMLKTLYLGYHTPWNNFRIYAPLVIKNTEWLTPKSDLDKMYYIRRAFSSIVK